MYRIISQNKKFDIPYDQAMLATWRTKDGASTVTATVNGTQFTIGMYKDAVRASAVMESIRRVYYGSDSAPVFVADEEFMDSLSLSVTRNRERGDILFALPRDIE